MDQYVAQKQNPEIEEMKSIDASTPTDFAAQVIMDKDLGQLLNPNKAFCLRVALSNGCNRETVDGTPVAAARRMAHKKEHSS